MKAVVYKKPFEVAVENVDDPTIKHPNDVIVKITSSCICGSDLHMYEGRTAAEPGIVFGHENMGVIEEIAERLEIMTSNISIIIVEQHVELALRIAESAFVMDRGNTVMNGPLSLIHI